MQNEQEYRFFKKRYQEEQDLREYEEQAAYETYIAEKVKGEK